MTGAAAATWPLSAAGQPAVKVHRVGMILTSSPVATMAGPDPVNPLVKPFVYALRDLGYVEGRNLVLERRSAEGNFDRFGEIVAELVDSKVDVIVTGGNELAEALKRVTSTVPIIMANSYDPVAAGLVASLARPGGNITGFTVHAGPEIEAKRLQMLKESVPQASHVAFLGLKSDWEGPQGTSVQASARMLGITLVHAEHSPAHFADAFALIIRNKPHALYVARHPAIFANRQLIVDFAVKHRVPGMYPYRESVAAGGLMSYGTNVPDLFRRAAGHVDKILKGTKPADLAVEQPTKFAMVINLNAAKALGVTIPPLLLAQADEVIE